MKDIKKNYSKEWIHKLLELDDIEVCFIKHTANIRTQQILEYYEITKDKDKKVTLELTYPDTSRVRSEIIRKFEDFEDFEDLEE